MSQIVHEFTVVRTVRGESSEIELKASFEIQSEIESAELDGDIFLVDGGIPWEGRLTKREKAKAEANAYESWAEGNDGKYSTKDDFCVVDSDFDDAFDDDMAIKAAGFERVYL